MSVLGTVSNQARTRLPRRAGGGLVEILVVLLLVSLLAAALMTGLMEKNAQLESAAEGGGAQAGTEDLAGLLELWTPDPQDLEGRDLKREGQARGGQVRGGHSLETPADRQAYRALVDQLEDRGQLDDWKNLVRKRLGEDHALLVVLEPEGEGNEPQAEPVEIRWADHPAQTDPEEEDDDPDVRWVD